MSELDDIELEAEDFNSSVVPIKKVPHGDLFEAARAGDADRLKYLLESGVNVNARDPWDSVALYYACLVGRLEIARILLESGAICSEHTFDGDRCHYAALNLKVRKLLKAFEARPPPLGALQTALRDTFLGCAANQQKMENEVVMDRSLSSSSANMLSGSVSNGGPVSSHFPPDIILYVQGRPIEAHRVVLSARSPFFRKKFETEWKNRTEIKLSKEKLSYIALYSLIHFFYSDRLEIGVEDMENLVRICKVCKCHSLQKLLEKELTHQRYADYKALKDIDDSQKRFILQGISLPEEDRLAASLHRMLQVSLSNSVKKHHSSSMINHIQSLMAEIQVSNLEDDLADMCVVVDKKIFRCHQVVLASRSDYFKARLLHVKDSPKDGLDMHSMACLIEHDLSMECFEKMIEYMYTDKLDSIDPDQAEEMFDAASRYLLFPLNRAVADALLPHLEMVSPAEICHWLLLSDLYSVLKIREYCLDMMACNFETFADTPEFRAMLLTLPPPSGNSELRTTVPSAPGAELNAGGDNLLDDLREKWLEAEGAELDERDDSALLFDKRLEMLMVVAKNEKLSMTDNALESTMPADMNPNLAVFTEQD